MSVDVSIYQNLLRTPKSVQEYDNEAMQAQQNKLNLNLSQQKADEYTRSIADANQLRSVVSGFGADRAVNQQALLKAGRLKEANEYGKSSADLAKTAAETEHENIKGRKAQLDMLQSANSMIGSAAGALAQNPTYEHATALVGELRTKLPPELAAKFGLDTFEVPRDPVALKQWADSHYRQAIDADKQLTDARIRSEGAADRKVQTDNSIRSAASSKYSADSSARTANNRLEYDKNQPKGVLTQTDQGPMLVDPRTGKAQPVTADGRPVQSAKVPTEFQGKSAAFGARAEQADKIISAIGDKYSPAAINAKQAVGKTWLVGGALEAATNKMALSENDQRAEQAQRDFINAVLRQESGAAISESEFENARRQYFPQPGDKKANLELKARNRKLTIQGFMNSAGKAAFHAPDDAAPSQHSPEIESLLNKYK